jgi:hypothetical protein
MESPFGPQDQHQQFRQGPQRLVRQRQIVQGLPQSPLLREGGDLDENVVRLALPGEIHAQQTVGVLAVLDDLARHRLDALYVLEAADEQSTFALVVQQPFAADVEMLSRHGETSVSRFIRSPN